MRKSLRSLSTIALGGACLLGASLGAVPASAAPQVDITADIRTENAGLGVARYVESITYQGWDSKPYNTIGAARIATSQATGQRLLSNSGETHNTSTNTYTWSVPSGYQQSVIDAFTSIYFDDGGTVVRKSAEETFWGATG